MSARQADSPDGPGSQDSPDFFLSGIRIQNLTQDEAVEKLFSLVAAGGSRHVAVVNAAKLVAATEDETLRGILRSAAIVTADGMSVVWASRLLGRRLKERVTGIDLFERLVGEAAGRGVPVYFFGAREASVRRVVEVFKSRFPNLRVAGYRNGYFEMEENDGLVAAIRESRAELLFVAMGSPAQEKWIAANLEKTGARLAMGVGGSFDHLSGLVRRAPRWMQRTGLEWLHRLWLEPRRLWKRYLVGNTRFIGLVLREGRGRKQARF